MKKQPIVDKKLIDKECAVVALYQNCRKYGEIYSLSFKCSFVAKTK